LRGLVESVEKLRPDTKINQALVRELKARGREIVDAWDSYQADRDRAREAVGLPELDRRGKEINEPRVRLWSQIAATLARTVEGMLAKIAFASKYYFGEREDLAEGTAEDLLLSAAMDYADLHGQEARA
jgi:DNA-binding protein